MVDLAILVGDQDRRAVYLLAAERRRHPLDIGALTTARLGSESQGLVDLCRGPQHLPDPVTTLDRLAQDRCFQDDVLGKSLGERFGILGGKGLPPRGESVRWSVFSVSFRHCLSPSSALAAFAEPQREPGLTRSGERE